MIKKWLTSIILVFLATMLVACGGGDADQSEPAPSGEDQLQMPEPELDDVPDLVAEVNNEGITKADFELTYISQFEQLAMQAQMTGQQLDQDQLKAELVESMINQELLRQEADRRGFEVTEDDVNTLIEEIVELNGLESREELFAVFEEQGTSEQEILNQIELQLKLDQLIDDEVGDFEPTQDELERLYDELVTQYEELEIDEEIPTFEEVQSDLEQELHYQVESETIMTLVEALRADAEIKNHMG